MIFYSIINNNKIVIRQLLWIRATVGCAGSGCSVWQTQGKHLGAGAAAPRRGSLLKTKASVSQCVS